MKPTLRRKQQDANFGTAPSKKTSPGGFTLVECIMAFVLLSVIHLSMLGIVRLFSLQTEYAADAYTAGGLLEGLMAEAQSAARNGTVIDFEPYILTFFEHSDAYDYTVTFRNIITDEVYIYASSPDNPQSIQGFTFSYSHTAPQFENETILSINGADFTVITDKPRQPWEIYAVCYNKDGSIINAMAGRY